MNEPAFIIPVSRMPDLPIEAQSAIYKMFGLGLNASSSGDPAVVDTAVAPAPVSAAFSPEPDGPPEFTLAMIRKLTRNPISPKTLALLRAISASPTPQFDQNDLLRKVDGAASYKDLAGSWSGITRRVRTILDDDSAYIVWWVKDPAKGEGADGEWTGRVSKLTHDSLRAYFNL